ncbi:efflux RND transporter periplasmic adaptor subunit [Luminiphilus sp.]|jgi:multidrug efflux system membrane fusion protein|nr:efflux RND transporter periplasmic adaptor subunit [Luminiphilus sp.]MDC6472189.1 efflux RND transporter periplasmic adaptor subunit [Luminiphilus sp.]
MSKNFISASVIASLIFVWLVSGLFVNPPNSVEEATSSAVIAKMKQTAPTEVVSRVRVSRINAEARRRSVTLRGRTEAKRIVEVTAEVAGQVVSRSVERGMQVSRGQLLCEIAIDDREVAVEEARAGLDKAQIEHAGSARLADQGLLSEVAIAASEARRQAAEAHLQRQILNLARTRVTAPFDGVVEDLHLDEGDYAGPGDSCATLIDLDPMLVTAQVTEEQVEYLQLGTPVSGTTRLGRPVEGELSFIGNQSDAVTRTYAVEITVDNQDYSLRSGLTVSLQVSLGDIWAHRVAPSLLSLNEQSVMGVRLIDGNNRVVFRPIEIIEDGPNGMWVTGLPSTAKIITVGQEYVREGALVDPVYGDSIDDQIVLR